MDPPLRVWIVFLAYGLAFVSIIITSIVAIAVLRSVESDLSDLQTLQGLPGLLAGGIASSTALLGTFLAASRGLAPKRLRLVPGRETGRDLGIMIIGMLALGQALDSLTVIFGLSGRGAMEAIRRALVGIAGPDLFLAVVVIGLLAGAAEELFFRSYMQSLLREHWRPALSIVVTSLCFGVLHLDWVHAPLAFVLGLYLGFITEWSGSALPAIVCHVVNNVVFTITTALVGSVPGVGLNVLLLGAATLTVSGCLLWLTREMGDARA